MAGDKQNQRLVTVRLRYTQLRALVRVIGYMPQYSDTLHRASGGSEHVLKAFRGGMVRLENALRKVELEKHD